ncbi:MAG: SHOCT domain-containing protein [Candidatus Desulfacyla sp.]
MASLRVFLLSCLPIFGSGLYGCGGGGAELQSHTTTTTIGQELIDLQSAYDKGVITKDPYESQKKKILKRD